MGKYKYKSIKVNGIKHDEHRYLMEQYLGRKLRRDEVVHHINEDGRDNDIKNLCVMSLSEHGRLHRPVGSVMSQEAKEKISTARAGKPNEKARKFSIEQIKYIRENYIPRDREFGARALSRKFGTHHSTIENVVNDKYYRDNIV
jgi:hypothetical protein